MPVALDILDPFLGDLDFSHWDIGAEVRAPPVRYVAFFEKNKNVLNCLEMVW